MALTRLAPTPSGFLHAGNRANISLTIDLARHWGARVALRIDDADASRYRREYVDDIFDTLARMAITWDLGPRDGDDFEAHWSQRSKTGHYRSALAAAREAGMPVYACACPRSAQSGPATGGCVGGCRERHLPLEPGRTALRVAIEPGTLIGVSGSTVDIATEMGDAVIWRRDDLPAYQLVSVVEDRDLGTTHIVRGEDLLPSSALQAYIAPWFGAANVASATYVHHALEVDQHGVKLSKSTLASTMPDSSTTGEAT